VTRAMFVVLASGLLALLIGCGGGGGNNDNPDPNTGPLKVVLFSASPDHGFASASSPLRVTLTWNITGGKAPYYYALDWNNDGQFDFYLNKVYNKTVSVLHDYYPVGTTPYQVALRVTDTEATVVRYPSTAGETPVTITVSSTQTVQFDPLLTYADNNNNAADTPPGDDYQFPSGTPVFFHSAVLNGTQPYEYQWDFNADGMIDSTVSDPQYTFTYDGSGLVTKLVRVTVVDNNGEKATKDFVLSILGDAVGPQPVPSFEIIMSTDPAESGLDTGTGFKLVDVPFLPGSTDPNIPTEPKLDLSVVVNPDPEKAGVPPYEYYWDYENDGAYDSQFQSPTIPFYDPVRKILVNPYALQASENQKTFILRCLVIDGAGRRQDEYRAVRVHRLTAEPGEFTGTPSYGVIAGPYAGKPYAEIIDADPDAAGMQYPETQVAFGVSNISGGLSSYQWKIDVDNDGFPETDWTNVSGNSFATNISFGPIGGGASDWPAVGYYPVRVSIRALDRSVTPPTILDEITYDMPVSLVMRPVTDDISGALKARAGHNVTVTFDNQTRKMIVMGGNQGTTPLRDVESIEQTIDADFNTPDPITATAHTSLLFSRHGALLFGNEAEGSIFLCGGFNLDNNILASMEVLGIDGIFNNDAWNLYGELSDGDTTSYLPLDQAMGQPAYINEALSWVGVGNAAYVFLGGMKATGGAVDDVYSRMISFDPGRPPFLPAFIPMDGGNRGMITQRYDGTAVYLEGERKLYVIGGRVASGQSVSTVEVFNFATTQWELGPSLQDARSGHITLVVDDGIRPLIYVLGGASYPAGGAQRKMVTTAEVYNPETGTWSYTLPPALPTENGAAAAVPSKDTIGFGSIASIWYFGGADSLGAESKALQELVYVIP
jgi:hypothetical protein